jgi:hypothetical protein
MVNIHLTTCVTKLKTGKTFFSKVVLFGGGSEFFVKCYKKPSPQKILKKKKKNKNILKIIFSASPAKTYLLGVICSIIGVIFLIGITCGRVTKRVTKENKMK